MGFIRREKGTRSGKAAGKKGVHGRELEGVSASAVIRPRSNRFLWVSGLKETVIPLQGG